MGNESIVKSSALLDDLKTTAIISNLFSSCVSVTDILDLFYTVPKLWLLRHVPSKLIAQPITALSISCLQLKQK